MANQTVTQQILSQLVLDDSQYQAAVARVKAGNLAIEVTSASAGVANSRLAGTYGVVGGAMEQMAARLDNNIRAMMNHERAQERIVRVGVQEGASLQQVNNLLALQAQAYARTSGAATQAYGRVGQSAAAAAAPIGNTGDKIRQVGFQLQDFAIQVQGGQSPFVALSQQGGQLAGALLGPTAALAATGILIGAMIGKTILFGDTVDKAAEAEKKFKEALEATNAVLLRRSQQDFIERQSKVAEAIKLNEAELQRLGTALSTAEEEFRRFALARELLAKNPNAGDQSEGAFGFEVARENLEALRQAYVAVGKALVDLRTPDKQFPDINKPTFDPKRVAETIDGLKAELEYTSRLVVVSKQNQEAIDRVTTARKAHEAIRALKLTADGAEGQSIIKLIGLNAENERQAKRNQAAREGEAARAQAVAAAIEKSSEDATKWMQDRAIAADRLAVTTQTDIDLLAKQAEAAQQSTVEFNELTGTYRLVTKALDELNKAAELEKGGLDPTRAKELAKAWAEGKQELDRVTDSQKVLVDRLNKQNELMLEPFKNAIQGIQGAFGDMFEGIFTGTTDLFSGLKRVAIRFASEIATLLVFRPIVAGALQSLGLGGLAQQMGLGGGAFGAGLSGSVGANGVDPTYMPPGMSGGGLGGLGGLLGIGGQGGLLGGGLTTILGGAGAGFAAPQILRQLGLGIGKGSPVGSGIGGIGGAVLGNFLLPGIGGILGGVAGGFLGDIFGGLFGGGGKSEDDIAREQYMAQRAQSLATLNTQTNAFIGRGSGAQSTIGQQIRSISDEGQSLKQQFYDLNDTSRMDEITQATLAQIKKLTDDFVKGMKDQTLAITDAGGEIKRSLDRNAEELRKSAQEAGVGLAEAEALITAQLNQARENIDRQNSIALGNLTGNPTAGYADLVRQQAERLSTVKSLGADIVQAEALAAAERLEYFKRLTDAQRELLRASLSEAEKALLDLAETGQTGADKLLAAATAMDAFSKSIDDFIDGLKLSDLSTLSPGAKYAQASAQFDKTLAGVQAGDPEAIARYQQDAQVFLTASRGIYGSGDQYAQDFQRVVSQSDMLKLLTADGSTALGRAGIDLGSVLASGSGALLDNKVTAGEAEPLLATIDELAVRLAGLVDPSHQAVQELSDLRDRIVATRDATEAANAAQPPGAEVPNTNPTPLVPSNDNSNLPGWQQGALAGGPSSGFRDGLIGALYPGLSYDQAPQAARGAVDSLFNGDAYSYLMMGGENATNTLINTGLYSALELAQKYGGIAFQGAESIKKLYEEWVAAGGDMGGNGYSGGPTGQNAPSTTPDAVTAALSDFNTQMDAFRDAIKGTVDPTGLAKGLSDLGMKSADDSTSGLNDKQITGLIDSRANLNSKSMSDVGPEGAGVGPDGKSGGTNNGTDGMGGGTGTGGGAFASGGWLMGPGGPRDDDINFRGSNGEFVVNAYSARRNAPMLEAINNDWPLPQVNSSEESNVALLAEVRAMRRRMERHEALLSAIAMNSGEIVVETKKSRSEKPMVVPSRRSAGGR